MTAMKNRPTRPTPGRDNPSTSLPYVVVGVLLALLLFATGAFLWLAGGAGAAVGGPFTLENAQGHTVTDKTFRGKYMLVYFGYTYCPDVCPTTLNEVASAMDHLGAKAAELDPIFITVDPARDTPEVIGRYTAAFSKRLVGLTGTPQEIAKVAREYHVYYAKNVTGPGPNDYTMDHSSVLYLMGPTGRFLAPIEASESGPNMAAAIAKLLS
jgi:protein SCO1